MAQKNRQPFCAPAVSVGGTLFYVVKGGHPLAVSARRLSALADRRWYAMNLFRKPLGTMLVHYMTGLCVFYALQLLAPPNDGVVDVALGSDFNSFSRFNDVAGRPAAARRANSASAVAKLVRTEFHPGERTSFKLLPSQFPDYLFRAVTISRANWKLTAFSSKR